MNTIQISQFDSNRRLNRFSKVFSTDLGKYTGPLLELCFDESVKPIRCKPRRVPISIIHKVDSALDQLLAQGVIEPVSDPMWGTPIVPIVKRDGSIRLCGDYKITINKAIRPHPHPVPVISQLIASIGNASVFGRLDLAQAYLQCSVSEDVALSQTIVQTVTFHLEPGLPGLRRAARPLSMSVPKLELQLLQVSGTYYVRLPQTHEKIGSHYPGFERWSGASAISQLETA